MLWRPADTVESPPPEKLLTMGVSDLPVKDTYGTAFTCTLSGEECRGSQQGATLRGQD